MTAQEREVPRVTPARARDLIREQDALLICAYDDEDKCRDHALPGAIGPDALRERRDDLDADRPLIFYCA